MYCIQKWVDRLRRILFPGTQEAQQGETALVVGEQRNEHRKSDHVIGLDQTSLCIKNQAILAQGIVEMAVGIAMATVLKVAEHTTSQAEDHTKEKLLKID